MIPNIIVEIAANIRNGKGIICSFYNPQVEPSIDVGP
jgi:hypothetical protein